MRSREFITERDEVKTGIKPHRDHEMVMPNAHRVAGTADRVYDLNRIMMLVAAADDKTIPPMEPESWAGRNNMSFPFTACESNMLKNVYAHLGYEWDDVLKPNPGQRSEEPRDTNCISPVAKKARNRYGV